MRDTERETRPFAKKLRSEMSEAEVWLWAKLRRHPDPSLKFRRQHPIGPYIADFAHLKARLVIEVDGATHSSDEEVARDVRRTAHLERMGWPVVRFTNDEVYRGVDNVVDAIWRLVDDELKSRG